MTERPANLSDERPEIDIKIECFVCGEFSRWASACPRFRLKRKAEVHFGKNYPKNRIPMKKGLCPHFREAPDPPGKGRWRG